MKTEATKAEVQTFNKLMQKLTRRLRLRNLLVVRYAPCCNTCGRDAVEKMGAQCGTTVLGYVFDHSQDRHGVTTYAETHLKYGTWDEDLGLSEVEVGRRIAEEVGKVKGLATDWDGTEFHTVNVRLAGRSTFAPIAAHSTLPAVRS